MKLTKKDKQRLRELRELYAKILTQIGNSPIDDKQKSRSWREIDELKKQIHEIRYNKI